MEDTLPDPDHQPTVDLVDDWRRRWVAGQRDSLVYRRIPDGIFIDDERTTARVGTHSFFGPLATVYDFCNETMRTADAVTSHLNRQNNGSRVAPRDVREALDEFCVLDLMIEDDGRYLSLALPANRVG